VPDLIFQRYDGTSAREVRATVEAIYQDSYTDAIASGDPFDSVETFMHRFEAYTAGIGFDMIVAYHNSEPVGQTWGWPLSEQGGARWWGGLLTEPERGFTREDGRRTFALSEIMVRQPYTGQRVAHRLHDELLSKRTEQRATLLVEPDNTRAYRAYLHWGWRKVAQLRPGWPDAPIFDVLVLRLPVAP
jgi:GNAT superfamily N-acetyltransferase